MMEEDLFLLARQPVQEICSSSYAQRNELTSLDPSPTWAVQLKGGMPHSLASDIGQQH